MGAATIISGGPTGLYNIQIVHETAKALARLTVIAKRLTDLTPLIASADNAVTAAAAVLSSAMALLDLSISQANTPVPSLTAIPRWYNAGKGTCTAVKPGPLCQAGRYSLTYGAFIPPDSTGFSVLDPDGGNLPVARIGSYSCSQIEFTTANGTPAFESGDAFDIDVTEASKVPVTPVTQAQAAVYAAQSDLQKKRRTLATLRLEKTSLEKEQITIQQAIAPVARNNTWCADLTEDMAVGKAVGTIEINGEQNSMLVMPAGTAGLGKLQPVVSSSPAGVFVNMAKLPCWQKWKPTYRVGEIKTITYETDKCSVCVDDAFSSAQGLKINQDGTVCSQAISAGIVSAGFAAFCAANPADPLVTNTVDSQITSTAQLIADLAEVNRDVNTTEKYKKDIDQYGLMEKWNYMQEGGSGDCEDFALTKLRKLLQKGYPISALKIEVGTTGTGAGHAWLTVQTDKGDLALDLNYSEVMPSASLPYGNRFRQTGNAWKRQGVLLSDVPIEYMDGANASAFEVGDRVVVAFIGQAWGSPKVIGFESHPRDGRSFYINRTGWHYPLIMGKYSITGTVKDAAYLSLPDWWGLPYSIFNGEIYLPREMMQGQGDPWADCLLVRVYNLKTKALVRTLTLHFFHLPASQNDGPNLFQWASSPLGSGGLSSVSHSASGTLYFAVTWFTMPGVVAWIRSGIYAFNHLTGADMGWYQYTGCRYGLPGGGQPGPIQQ